MTRDRYLFDHIPRTGGMSMKAIFDGLFGPENVSPIVRAHASQIMAQWETKTMITGHFWHSPGSLANRRRFYLTLLRRPEDRTLSLYYFYRHNVQDEDDQAVQLAKTMELQDFLMSEDPVVLQTIQNFAVRHFRQLSMDGYAGANDDAQNLTAAKEVLEQYDFVGIHEEFEDSLDMLCYQFGWPAVQTIPAINRALERKALDDLDPALHARLRDLNRLDIELYEHGLRLFAERKRATMRQFIDLKRMTEALRVEPEHVQFPPTAPSGAVSSSQFGDKMVEILGVEVKGVLSGNPVLQSGEEGVIVIEALARGASDDFTVGIAIRDAAHQMVFGTNSYHLGERWSVRPGVAYSMEFRMRMALGEGIYFVTVALHEGPGHFQHCFHWWEDAAPFEVRGRSGRQFHGSVDLSPTLLRRESPPLSEFSASLAPQAAPDRALAGATFSLPIRIKNVGDQTWPSSGPRPVHVSYHWLDESGNMVIFDGLRTPLPQDMRGGDEADLHVSVKAPVSPGAYTLRITLVQENVAWFDSQGLDPLDLPVLIDPD
jgi:hypothetical protein